jgi:hypothetical protein
LELNKIKLDYIIRIVCENSNKNNDMNFMISVYTDNVYLNIKSDTDKDDVEGMPCVGNQDHGR